MPCSNARYSAGRHLRCDQTFNHRVICQIQEHDNVVGDAAFLKRPAEDSATSYLTPIAAKTMANSFIRVIAERCLLYDLGGKLVSKAGRSGKDRKFPVP